MNRVASAVVRVRDSLYAIPALTSSSALPSLWPRCISTTNFDELVGDWPVVLETTVAGGRAIASTVAGATITVAAIVFSMTALTTQTASNQYSPRALGEFFEDPVQQTIIGLVVGTFTYSLLLLASMGSDILDGADARPNVAATLCIALGVSSAIGVIAYIYHSTRRLHIDSMVRGIADASIEGNERHLARDSDRGVAAPAGREPWRPRGTVVPAFSTSARPCRSLSRPPRWRYWLAR